MISGILAATDPRRLFLVDREDEAVAELSYGDCRAMVDELVRSHPELSGSRVGLRATGG